VTNKLKNPPNNEKTQSPAPTKNEERQRQNNHRDADTVRQPIQRMLMFGFVVIKETLLHVSLGLWTLDFGLGQKPIPTVLSPQQIYPSFRHKPFLLH